MARDPKKFYVGNPAHLWELPVPDPGFSVTDKRAGSSNVTLWGTRAVHTFGYGRVYDMSWSLINGQERAILDRLYKRYHAGPYVLFDPQFKNLLPEEHASCTRTDRSYGLTADPGKVTIIRDPAYLSTIGFDTFWVWNPLGYESTATTHGDYLKDWVMPGEEMTYSFTWNSAAADTDPATTMQVVFFGPDNSYIGGTTPITLVKGVWDRVSVTFTVPDDAVRIQPYWDSEASATPGVHTHYNYIGGPQLEFGPTATDWEPGAGVPKVALTELDVDSPLLGLFTASGKIVEV